MWQMLNYIGLSVYLSFFEQQKPMLEVFKNTQSFIFTSFHIQEEMDENYRDKAVEMCRWLKEYDFKIIGDVSPKTLKAFQCKDLSVFAQTMGIDVLRLDYGFTDEEILEISNQLPIAFNASTIVEHQVSQLVQSSKQVFGMHNFYPRPETGLDEAFFSTINQRLASNGIEVLAFIPGDEVKRGPIFEGLPTLESHRKYPPYVAFLDLAVNHKIDGIFVGDVRLSPEQLMLIGNYLKNQVVEIPATLLPEHENLYNRVFTIRADSPQPLMRLQESREYATAGDKQMPHNCVARSRGDITMDNSLYRRYSGEIQILRTALPQDDRVNVIGAVLDDYLPLLESIKNGDQIKLRRP